MLSGMVRIPALTPPARSPEEPDRTSTMLALSLAGILGGHAAAGPDAPTAADTNSKVRPDDGQERGSELADEIHAAGGRGDAVRRLEGHREGVGRRAGSEGGDAETPHAPGVHGEDAGGHGRAPTRNSPKRISLSH